MIEVICPPFVLMSALFCNASLRRFERFGLELNWVEEPSPDIDIAVDNEPYEHISHFSSPYPV